MIDMLDNPTQRPWMGMLCSIARKMASLRPSEVDAMKRDASLVSAIRELDDGEIIGFFDTILDQAKRGSSRIHGNKPGQSKLAAIMPRIYANLVNTHGFDNDAEKYREDMHYYAVLKYFYPWFYHFVAMVGREPDTAPFLPMPKYELQAWNDQDPPSDPYRHGREKWPVYDALAEIPELVGKPVPLDPPYTPAFVGSGGAPRAPRARPSAPAPAPAPAPVPAPAPSEPAPEIPVNEYLPDDSLPSDILTVARSLMRRQKWSPGDSRDPSGSWTVAESPNDMALRFKNIADKLPTLRKLHKIFGYLKNGPYVWTRKRDADVYTSIWLVKDGSIVLKGVPGTGKTQLVEMTVTFFGNDVFKLSEEEIEEQKYLHARSAWRNWLVTRGILGEAKHNQDKEPLDVFFSSSVNIDKYRLAVESATPLGFARREVPEPEPAEPEPTPDSPAPNPLPSQYKDKYGKAKYPYTPDEVDSYSIEPVPRAVTTAFIKFHNEANRMNSNVADTLLGLMAEGRVEYQGKTFLSPGVWIPTPSPEDPWGGYVTARRTMAGQINIFDYNPHLEVERPEMELDRALLDRITAGLYLPAGDLGTRFGIMMAAKEKPEYEAYLKMARREIEPITVEELRGLWSLVGAIPRDAEFMLMVALLTNIPNLTNVRYQEQYYLDMPAKTPIGKSEASFVQVLDAAEGRIWDGAELESQTVDAKLQAFVQELRRPLGVRSTQSLVKVAQSVLLLNQLESCFERNDGNPSDAKLFEAIAKARLVIPNESTRDDMFDYLTELLPYILDHRVNLGVGRTFKERWLNTFHGFTHFARPLMRNATNSKRYYAYITASARLFTKYGHRNERGAWVTARLPKATVESDFDGFLVEEYNRRGINNQTDWTVERVKADAVQNSFLMSLRTSISYYQEAE